MAPLAGLRHRRDDRCDPPGLTHYNMMKSWCRDAADLRAGAVVTLHDRLRAPSVCSLFGFDNDSFSALTARPIRRSYWRCAALDRKERAVATRSYFFCCFMKSLIFREDLAFAPRRNAARCLLNATKSKPCFAPFPSFIVGTIVLDRILRRVLALVALVRIAVSHLRELAEPDESRTLSGHLAGAARA